MSGNDTKAVPKEDWLHLSLVRTYHNDCYFYLGFPDGEFVMPVVPYGEEEPPIRNHSGTIPHRLPLLAQLFRRTRL